MSSSARASAALVVLLLVSATATGRGELLRQHLDERTALVLTGLQRPLILHKDEPGLAANARDYIQLGPLEINRQGELRYYLWMSIWSTIDRAGDLRWRQGFEVVHVFADGEPVDVELSAWNLARERAEVSFYEKPVHGAVDAFYPVTLDQLRRIAAATEVYAVAGPQSRDRYQAWEWSPSALRAFVEYGRDRLLR